MIEEPDSWMTTTPSNARTEQLRHNLATVHDAIAAACAAAGRPRDAVSLTVVTKFFPEADVRRLANLGVTDVGENRHQEAQVKAQACADLGLRWHFIGSIQSNKAAAIARYADIVESVDRLKVARGLARGAAQREDGSPLKCLIQISLDPPGHGDGRSGVAPERALELAEFISQQPVLQLRGVMAVAPLGLPPEPAFEQLAAVAQTLRGQFPEAEWISAGMSHDLAAAIQYGATHVRVGSAILGPRPQIK